MTLEKYEGALYDWKSAHNFGMAHKVFYDKIAPLYFDLHGFEPVQVEKLSHLRTLLASIDYS